MDRISINLLPLNLKENKKLDRKKKLVNQLSIGILGILILITTGLVVTALLQKNSLEQKNQATTNLENKLLSLREKEAATIILKKRLAVVSQIINKQYPQTDSFILVTSLLPPNLQVQSFNVDQANQVSLQGSSENAADLQHFFDNLSDPKINEAKIAKTTISSLSRGPTPKLIYDLLITTSFGGDKK